MTADEVPLWAVDRGIGHAVQRMKGGFTMTACGTWGNLGGHTKTKPKRICVRCRERLKDATLVPEAKT